MRRAVVSSGRRRMHPDVRFIVIIGCSCRRSSDRAPVSRPTVFALRARALDVYRLAVAAAAAAAAASHSVVQPVPKRRRRLPVLVPLLRSTPKVVVKLTNECMSSATPSVGAVDIARALQ